MDSVSVWEPTISETSLCHVVFMVTLLDRFYSFKYTDAAMRPLRLSVVDLELESVCKTWDAVVLLLLCDKLGP